MQSKVPFASHPVLKGIFDLPIIIMNDELRKALFATQKLISDYSLGETDEQKLRDALSDLFCLLFEAEKEKKADN